MSVPTVIAVVGGIALLVGIFGGGVEAEKIKIPTINARIRVFSAITGMVLIATAVLLSSPELLSSVPPTQQLPSPTVPLNQSPSTATQAEVYAKEDWQDTGIQVEVGQFIALEYLSGTWSECPDYGCNYYDAGAKDASGNVFDDPSVSDNVISDCPGPTLIARISNNLPFCVGLNYVGQVAHSGNLQLRINDMAIDDNGGSVVVSIEVK